MEAPPAWSNPAASASPSSSGVSQHPQVHPSQIDASQHEQELFAKYSTLNEPVIETIMRDVRAVAQKLHIVLQPIEHSSRTLYWNSISQVYNYTAVASNDPTIPTTHPSMPQAATANSTATSEEITPTLSDNDRLIIKQLKDWDLWGPLFICLSLGIILSMKAPTNQAALTFAAVFTSIWVGSTVVTINAQLLGGTISFFQSVCVLGYSVFPLMISALIIGCFKLIINLWLWIDLIIVGVGCVWALRVSSVFISLYVQRERRALALYPVVFFYTFLAWLILLF
jgi:protein YIPF6